MSLVLFDLLRNGTPAPCRDGRVLRPERLATASLAAARQNLRDLARINRYLGPHRLLAGLIGEIAPTDEAFTFLDVGAASGDMGESVRRRFPGASGCSLDLHLRHLAHATGPRVAADARLLPFGADSFDFVFCSLLLHEFANDDARRLLSSLYRLARRALIVLDLYRHPIAYHFLPVTRRLFGWGEITVHDGPASVEAGFHPRDLRMLARDAGLPRVKIRRHLPWFRVSMVALK